MRFVKGPDFPTGGLILGRQGIIDAYRTGRGSIRMRARATIEETRNGSQIVVTELPYQASPRAIQERIAELVNSRELEGITGYPGPVGRRRHEDRHPAQAGRQRQRRPQQPVQADAATDQFRGQHGGAGQRAGRGRSTLKSALEAYVAHQVDVVTRRSEYRLRRAQARAHIVEGLIKGPRHDRRHYRGHPGVREPG